MPELIASPQIPGTIELITEQAGSVIYIVSPEIHLTETLFMNLAQASSRGVSIHILCGTVPEPAAARLLSVLKNVTLGCVDNMNSRCYFNEQLMAVTSMELENTVNSSAMNTGILISKINDSHLYNSILKEIDAALLGSVKLRFSADGGETLEVPDAVYRGFCIGCGMPVTFNPERPFCNMCRHNYTSAGNNERGGFCHSCGCPCDVTLSQSLCRKCLSL